MKLLLDQNLSARIADHLRTAGFVAEHVSAVGMRCSSGRYLQARDVFVGQGEPIIH